MNGPIQDPTPWELLGALQQMRDDLRSDFTQLGARLAEMVAKDAYAADRRADVAGGGGRDSGIKSSA